MSFFKCSNVSAARALIFVCAFYACISFIFCMEKVQHPTRFEFLTSYDFFLIFNVMNVKVTVPFVLIRVQNHTPTVV